MSTMETNAELDVQILELDARLGERMIEDDSLRSVQTNHRVKRLFKK